MNAVQAMPEIQYLRIVAGVTAVDFDNGTADSSSALTGYIPKEQPVTEQTVLTIQLKSPVTHPLFIALGFTCFLKTNAYYNELYNMRFRALSIIYVH